MKFARWSLFPVFLALCACSLLPREKQETEAGKSEPAEGPQLVGRIASIAADRRFVLIQSYGPWKNEAGTILTTRGEDERVANLLVTGEVLGQFAAADIQSGALEIGDAVYSLHVPKPSEAAANPETRTEAAENQTNTEFENVQKNN